MKCGEKIRYFREQLGISQDELARRTGYAGRSAVSRIESGARDISQSKLKLFANVLGVEPVSLVSDKEPEADEQKRDIERQKMIEFVERIPSEQVKIYSELLKLPIERLEAVITLLK